MKQAFLSFLFLVVLSHPLLSQIYLAPDGDDNNPGTFLLPFATFPKAILEANPGDTIYVRGGVYILTNTILITAVKNGTAGQLYTLTAY